MRVPLPVPLRVPLPVPLRVPFRDLTTLVSAPLGLATQDQATGADIVLCAGVPALNRFVRYLHGPF